jgi:hypothetical protein
MMRRLADLNLAAMTRKLYWEEIEFLLLAGAALPPRPEELAEKPAQWLFAEAPKHKRGGRGTEHAWDRWRNSGGVKGSTTSPDLRMRVRYGSVRSAKYGQAPRKYTEICHDDGNLSPHASVPREARSRTLFVLSGHSSARRALLPVMAGHSGGSPPWPDCLIEAMDATGAGPTDANLVPQRPLQLHCAGTGVSTGRWQSLPKMTDKPVKSRSKTSRQHRDRKRTAEYALEQAFVAEAAPRVKVRVMVPTAVLGLTLAFVVLLLTLLNNDQGGSSGQGVTGCTNQGVVHGAATPRIGHCGAHEAAVGDFCLKCDGGFEPHGALHCDSTGVLTGGCKVCKPGTWSNPLDEAGCRPCTRCEHLAGGIYAAPCSTVSNSACLQWAPGPGSDGHPGELGPGGDRPAAQGAEIAGATTNYKFGGARTAPADGRIFAGRQPYTWLTNSVWRLNASAAAPRWEHLLHDETSLAPWPRARAAAAPWYIPPVVHAAEPARPDGPAGKPGLVQPAAAVVFAGSFSVAPESLDGFCDLVCRRLLRPSHE